MLISFTAKLYNPKKYCHFSCKTPLEATEEFSLSVYKMEKL